MITRSNCGIEIFTGHVFFMANDQGGVIVSDEPQMGYTPIHEKLKLVFDIAEDRCRDYVKGTYLRRNAEKKAVLGVPCRAGHNLMPQIVSAFEEACRALLVGYPQPIGTWRACEVAEVIRGEKFPEACEEMVA